MPSFTPIAADSQVGRLVVERGLATQDEVAAALEQLRSASAGSDPSQRSLGDVLIEQGVVTRRQIERLRPEVEETRGGQQIPGYQILSRLGAGAMATVYKAKQVSLDRVVAIKVLPQKYSSDANWVRRFYDEGKAAAKLNHANIVQAIDVGQAGEFHYFVMEYVEGQTVYDRLVKDGRFSEDEALDILIDTTRALEHAHAAGFIHRDVKPKNLMLTRDGVTKLADMGLARAITDREAAEAEAGKAYGTPYYISPEQIRGEVDVDFRADIYSLGATAYHMVTGKVPFEAPNPSAVMHKHLKEELVPPDHLNTDLTAGFSEIIEVCMAKKRAKRYNATSDLLADLLAVKNGEPPLQARQMFDIAQLSALEDSGEGESELARSPEAGPGPLIEQPVFWAAVAGWAFGLLMLIALVLALTLG